MSVIDTLGFNLPDGLHNKPKKDTDNWFFYFVELTSVTFTEDGVKHTFTQIDNGYQTSIRNQSIIFPVNNAGELKGRIFRIDTKDGKNDMYMCPEHMEEATREYIKTGYVPLKSKKLPFIPIQILRQ